MTLQRVLEKYHRQKLFTHAFVGCSDGSNGQILAIEEIIPDGDHIFDLASLTKALVTTPLCLQDAQEGLSPKLTFGEWLKRPWEELDSRLLDLPVRSLLRHESGLPAWRNFWTSCLPSENASNSIIERLNLIAGQLNPDPKSVYSDVGYILLGLGLERKYRASLPELFVEFCARELGVAHDQLGLKYGPIAKGAISTGICPVRGRELKGEVHDENCWALGGACGHAGLFGTGYDVISYANRLLSSEVGRKVVELNRREVVSGPNEPCLGWRQAADFSSETFGGGSAIGHMGFTGCAFWLRSDDRVAVVLTNRVISGRTDPHRRIAAMRRELLDIIDKI